MKVIANFLQTLVDNDRLINNNNYMFICMTLFHVNRFNGSSLTHSLCNYILVIENTIGSRIIMSYNSTTEEQLSHTSKGTAI